MKIKAFAVIDTNVLVSASLSSSYPRQVLDLINKDNIIPIFDDRIINEYKDVLSRKKFSFSQEDVYDTLHCIVSKGLYINDVQKTLTALTDKDDIPFFEVKESSEDLDSYLVTGNIKHFPESVSTVTPKEFINILRTLDRFVSKDYDYERIIEELIKGRIASSKYSSGEDLLNSIFSGNETIESLPESKESTDKRYETLDIFEDNSDITDSTSYNDNNMDAYIPPVNRGRSR